MYAVREPNRIDEKGLMLLRLIPFEKENGIGLLELLNRTKRRSPKDIRIGSQHTLEMRLEKLEGLRLIAKREGRHVGRGHKKGYYLTMQGKLLLEDKNPQAPELNFESPELELLKTLPSVSTDDRDVSVFSDPPLSLVMHREELSDLLEEVDRHVHEGMIQLENAFEAAHERTEAFLKSRRWTSDKKAVLDLLRRRYEIQQQKGIKSFRRMRSKYPPEVIRTVRTFNRKRLLLSREERREPFTPDTIPLYLAGKQLDDVPLSRREYERYRELLRLEKMQQRAWAAMKEPSVALLVCNKRFIDELRAGALLVETGDWKYESLNVVLKRLSPSTLIQCEEEFWEAVNTDKYAKDLMLIECDENGVDMGGSAGPSPGATAGLAYPLRSSFLSYFGLVDRKEAHDLSIPLNLRLRKTYFQKMHKAILKEIRLRGLTEHHHNANATYKDIIDSHRKTLEDRYGSLEEPKIVDQGLRINAFFRIPGLSRSMLVPRRLVS